MMTPCHSLSKIMDQDSTFSDLVNSAIPYAHKCGDLAGFASTCAEEVLRSGEPAFYMTTLKDINQPKSFPVALQMWSYDETSGQSVVIATLDIERPKYRGNMHGFMGNHLVVALLELARSELQSRVPEGVEVLTSRTKWDALIHGSGYFELKAQRALHRSVPEVFSARKPSRL